MDNPYTDLVDDLKTASENRRIVELAAQILQNRDEYKGCITETRDLLKQASLHPTPNALWDIPLGSNPQGINGACPPELLHQYGLGMEKYTIQYIWKMVEEGCSTAKALELESRFQRFNVRHADNSMPRDRFVAGTRNLAYVSAREYRAMCYQVSSCMRFFPVLCANVFLYCVPDDCLSWRNQRIF
jgi:hypothetical protein